MNTIKHLSLAILLFGTQPIIAQSKLSGYIQQGLQTNESIRQQQFLLEKNLYALKEAKALFLPNIGLNSSYSLAGGGRTIDFPVADLLNPVYKNLNQLNGNNNYPELQNKSIQLNPNNFYDVKIHTTYPVINAELVYNKKIKSQQYDLQKTEVSLYKRELAKEIKIAYYKYLEAAEAIRIYQSTLLLANENARINTALFNNQKVNRTAVTRSNNEVTKITAELKIAEQNTANAKAYFNFLVNRPLADSIESDHINSLPSTTITNDTAVDKREEIAKLNTVKAINMNLTWLANSYKMPKLNAFLDLGSQGSEFKINNKTPYYFLGLSLEFNLFAGGKNKYKVRQTEADAKAIQSQTGYVEQQLRLQVNLAINSFTAAVANYEAAQSQVAASEKYYKDMFRLYKEGTALFIELLDAQNQLHSAQIQANISLYDSWIKQAEIERANAGLIIQ